MSRKFSNLASILEKNHFRKIDNSEEKIVYSLWDSPSKGNHGFPKVTVDLDTGEQTYRLLIPDKPDWSKCHWELTPIPSKEAKEEELKKTGYRRIRNVTLHVAKFVGKSGVATLNEVKNLGLFISTEGQIDRCTIQKMLGFKKFTGSYDDFIFGEPWEVWKILRHNPAKIERFQRKGVIIKKVKDKIFLIKGKAPDGVTVRPYLNLNL